MTGATDNPGRDIVSGPLEAGTIERPAKRTEPPGWIFLLFLISAASSAASSAVIPAYGKT